MVEMGGTKLGQLFSNTDPWSGGACEREDCYTCHQGGADRLEDCFRRNILYESTCVVCAEEQERKDEEESEGTGAKKRKRKPGINKGEKGVYVSRREGSVLGLLHLVLTGLCVITPRNMCLLSLYFFHIRENLG